MGNQSVMISGKVDGDVNINGLSFTKADGEDTIDYSREVSQFT